MVKTKVIEHKSEQRGATDARCLLHLHRFGGHSDWLCHLSTVPWMRCELVDGADIRLPGTVSKWENHGIRQGLEAKNI